MRRKQTTTMFGVPLPHKKGAPHGAPQHQLRGASVRVRSPLSVVPMAPLPARWAPDNCRPRQSRSTLVFRYELQELGIIREPAKVVFETRANLAANRRVRI